MKCERCGKIIEFDWRKDRKARKTPLRFCSRSCSNVRDFTNEQNRKKGRPNSLGTASNSEKNRTNEHYCEYCGGVFYAWPNRKRKYCSLDCQHKYQRKQRTKRFLSGDINNPSQLRKELKQHLGERCGNCKNTEWMGAKIPLEVHHIDGDSTNNHPDNLDLLCPNCHALTDTYKAKNTGNGRHYRRQRYAEGKSY